MTHAPLRATSVWQSRLIDVLRNGQEVAPRGQRTLEVLGAQSVVDMNFPVIVVPQRKLNYQYMAAEAYWILSGSNRLDDLLPYNPRMREYSDDGVTLSGAYGPPITEQLAYVVTKLTEDESSRQAFIVIAKPNPVPTKDLWCTLVMVFQVRQGRVHTHVCMRASDAWLGWPYDVFCFSMVSVMLCALLNLHRTEKLAPGGLYLTMASSHLYEQHWCMAETCASPHAPLQQTLLNHVPRAWYTTPYPWPVLLHLLGELRDTKPGDPRRWWEIRSVRICYDALYAHASLRLGEHCITAPPAYICTCGEYNILWINEVDRSTEVV